MGWHVALCFEHDNSTKIRGAGAVPCLQDQSILNNWIYIYALYSPHSIFNGCISLRLCMFRLESDRYHRIPVVFLFLIPHSRFSGGLRDSIQICLIYASSYDVLLAESNSQEVMSWACRLSIFSEWHCCSTGHNLNITTHMPVFVSTGTNADTVGQICLNTQIRSKYLIANNSVDCWLFVNPIHSASYNA